MNKAELDKVIAVAYDMHDLGHNCAQCVALSVCELLDFDQDQMFRYAEGLGGGMGGFTQTCGAISGGVLVLSYANCNGVELHNTKQATYDLVSKLVERFQERFGSTMCPDLRPEEAERRKPVCNTYIAGTIELTIELLEEMGKLSASCD